MNIIEKLGITPGKWQLVWKKNLFTGIGSMTGESNGCSEFFEVGKIQGEANAHLIAAAPEILEVLIFQTKVFENIVFGRLQKWEVNVFDKLNEAYVRQVKAIEKACYPKSWEEIKGLK